MNFLAYGPVSLASGVVIASSVMSTDMSPGMLQGGVMAILGWTLYYVFVKLLPAERKAQKDQRDAFLKLLKDLNLTKKD